MSDSISPLLQWLNLHPQLAGLVTFIISAAESVAIIGTIVPGTITMTAIGTLIGAGVIPLWSTFIWAFLGSIAGDNISYWLGYYFKDNLHRVWPFRSYPSLLTTGETFFAKHGAKSVFIGRFIGPTRAIVPVVAGMLRMQPWRFIIVSIVASAAWAPAYMLPGIILGAATTELPADIASQMVLRLLLSSLFIVLCIWTSYRIFLLIQKQINHFLNKIWRQLLRSRYFHIITTVLKHHNVKKTHGQLTLAFYFTLFAMAFSYLSLYIFWHHSKDIALDNAIFYIFRSIRTPSLDDTMLWITLLGDKIVLIPAIGALFIYLGYKRKWHTAWHALVLLLLTACSIVLFKHIIHSARPWGIMRSPEDFSYPSGHTTLSMTFYVGLTLLLVEASSLKRKWIPYTCVGILMLTISISRLYLGAHWFTDILGGWLLSGTLLFLISISYNRKAEAPLQIKYILLTAISTMLVSIGVVHHHNYNKLQTNYAQAPWPTHNISITDWWDQKPNEDLPFYRVGLIGTKVELINLQWLGNLDDIKALLMKQGWELPPKRIWTDVLHRLTDVGSADHLPIVSPLYLDKKPVLVLVKNFKGEKHPIVLRLWHSNINITGLTHPQTLWVGVVGSVPRTYSWLITYKRNNHIDVDTATLFTKPQQEYITKEQQVMTKLKHKHHQQPILLIKPKSIS